MGHCSIQIPCLCFYHNTKKFLDYMGLGPFQFMAIYGEMLPYVAIMYQYINILMNHQSVSN